MNRAVVLRTGLRLARRQLWHAGRPRRGLLPLLLVLSIAAITWLALGTLFQTLTSADAPRAWATNVLAWAFTLSFVMAFLGGLHVTVNALIADPDLERLIATPAGAWDLLLMKSAATLPRTAAAVAGIALPAALAYALTQPDPGGLAWRLPVALFTLWAVPLSAAVLVALPLLRIAPFARLRESLAVLATVAFLAGWLANAFWVPRVLGRSGALPETLRALPEAPAWAPATWAAQVVSANAPGPYAIGCLFMCAIAILWAAHSARALLGALQEQLVAPLGRTVRAPARRARTLGRAFLRRDAALVSRDWPVLLDAMAQLALWTLLPLAVLPVAPLPALELARAMLITLCVSLGHDVAARALPLERSALAWARLSPVGGARWVRQRALGVAIVSGVILAVAGALVCTALRLPLDQSMDAMAFALGAGATMSGAGLALGAHLGDPEWSDPRAMLGAGGRGLAAGVLLTLAAAWLTLAHVASPAHALHPAALLVIIGAGALSGALGIELAARRLERQEFTSR